MGCGCIDVQDIETNIPITKINNNNSLPIPKDKINQPIKETNNNIKEIIFKKNNNYDNSENEHKNNSNENFNNQDIIHPTKNKNSNNNSINEHEEEKNKSISKENIHIENEKKSNNRKPKMKPIKIEEDNSDILVMKNNKIKNYIEEIEEINENNLKQKLKILLINLEAIKVDKDIIKDEINICFEDIFELYENEVDMNEIKAYTINKYSNIIIRALNLEEQNNSKDITFLKKLIEYLYEKEGSPDTLKDFLFAVLDNLNDFKNFSTNNEIRIKNYIIDFMKRNMMEQKNDLKNMYKINTIIKYENFIDIVLNLNNERVFMENIATEYLLYKMKEATIKDNKIDALNRFDIQIFLDFYDKKKEDLIYN